MVSSIVILVYRQYPLQHLGRLLVFAEASRGPPPNLVEGHRNLQRDPGHSASLLYIDGAFEECPWPCRGRRSIAVGCAQVPQRLRHSKVVLVKVLLILSSRLVRGVPWLLALVLPESPRRRCQDSSTVFATSK